MSSTTQTTTTHIKRSRDETSDRQSLLLKRENEEKKETDDKLKMIKVEKEHVVNYTNLSMFRICESDMFEHISARETVESLVL